MDSNKSEIKSPIALKKNIDEENENYLEVTKNKIKLKKKDSTPAFLTGLLTILLIASYIFIPKVYSPANHIYINGSILVYPLTFLIITIMLKKYTFTEVRKSIYTSSALFLLFLLIMCIGITPKANTDSTNYNIVIQFLFANNNYKIGEFNLFYPVLCQVFGVIVPYFISHLLYATLYVALISYTLNYLAVLLSLFIAYIIDRSLYVTIYFANDLLNNPDIFNTYIKYLTSEYIAAILMVVIILFLDLLFIPVQKNKSS